MDVTSGYFSNFSPPSGGTRSVWKNLLVRIYDLRAKGDIAAHRDIYFSFHPPYFSPIGGPSRKEKKREWRSRIIRFANAPPLFLEINKNLSTWMRSSIYGTFSGSNRLYFWFFFFFFFLFPFSSSSLDRRKIFRPRRLSSLYVDSKSVDTKGT